MITHSFLYGQAIAFCDICTMMAEPTIFKTWVLSILGFGGIGGMLTWLPCTWECASLGPIFGGWGKTGLKCCFLLNMQLWAWKK